MNAAPCLQWFRVEIDGEEIGTEQHPDRWAALKAAKAEAVARGRPETSARVKDIPRGFQP